jgi:GNAT superfamily N-acetyltransferase
VTLARGSLEALRDAQETRFAGLDPLLAVSAPNPDGEMLTAATDEGRRVAGVLLRRTYGPGSSTSLWSARDNWELFPLVGADTGAGMDALLVAWRRLMDGTGVPDADSACVVTWPSRDAEGTSALLAHGFQPLSVFAMRQPGDTPGPDAPTPKGLAIRRVTPRDIETVMSISLAELAYSALVGGTIVRPDAADIKRAAIRYRIAQGDPAWLAERDGVALALAECWITDSDPRGRRRFPVPPGRWGFVNTLSVLPGARGGGVGQAMMATAHRELHGAGAVGTYLYYNPPNPLSSVFWPRQGYRPLWTIWETRPAGALR